MVRPAGLGRSRVWVCCRAHIMCRNAPCAAPPPDTAMPAACTRTRGSASAVSSACKAGRRRCRCRVLHRPGWARTMHTWCMRVTPPLAMASNCGAPLLPIAGSCGGRHSSAGSSTACHRSWLRRPPGAALSVWGDASVCHHSCISRTGGTPVREFEVFVRREYGHQTCTLPTDEFCASQGCPLHYTIILTRLLLPRSFMPCCSGVRRSCLLLSPCR